MKKIGVLALQGAVSEHIAMLGNIGFSGVPVRCAEDLVGLSGLILPGGESTAISRLIRRKELADPIRAFAAEMPVLGTCAGMILCAKEARGSGGVLPGQDEGAEAEAAVETTHEITGELVSLGLIDVAVKRNGFGRQVDSFETALDIPGIGEGVPAVFIRAPYVEKTGKSVTVLAEYEGKAVMAQSGNVTVTAFHPELADDLRIFRHVFGR